MLANRVRMSYIKKGIPSYYVMATDSDFSGTADGEFKYIGSHEYVIIPHIIKGVNVTSYQDMFSGATYLSLKGIASDNPNVTDMTSLFFNFNTGDTTLDLSSFDTSNVTDMMGMFGFCKLTSLDLSNFDTFNVTNMGMMFYSCSSLTSLDLSNFDTSNVTSMGLMIDGCSSLTSLDLSSFDTSSVTHMNQMFNRCSSLTSLDLSSFDTSSVTHMELMFDGCTSVTTAYARTQTDANRFNASSNKPSNVNFDVLYMATDEDFSGTADGEFKYIGTATSVVIPHVIKGVEVTSYNAMFSGSNVREVRSNNPNVTNMSNMFYSCESLTSLVLSNFDTSNVTTMGYMFYNCNSLASLDLSSFVTTNVTDVQQMFDGCSSITTAYARTQEDANRFNNSSNKPSNVNFVLKIKWQTAQDIVRAGEASNYFNIGDEFVSLYDGRDIIWQVIGIDVDTPSDSNFTHSMTIQTKDCVENRMWSYQTLDNRYIDSSIRDYLNSSFLSNLDPELSAVIGLVNKKVAVPDAIGGQDSFSDKVFLLSRKEVDSDDEGVTTGEFVYPFYDGKGDVNRIKDGSSVNWWLRSPYVSDFYQVYVVSVDGLVGYTMAGYSNIGVSPACVII